MSALPERRPPLTYLGGDVAIVGRRRDDKAVVAFLDRQGGPAGRWACAFAHELRGVGWHIAGIKRAIAAAPLLDGAPDCTVIVPAHTSAEPAPRLHAHFTLPEGDR